MAKSHTARVAGYQTRIPKGSTANSPKVRDAVSKLASDKKLSQSDKCTIVLFRSGSSRPVAIQRCEGRSLSTGAKARWNRMKGKKVCRAKGRGKFKACR